VGLTDLIPGLGTLRALGIGLMVAGACSTVAGLVGLSKGKTAGRAEVQARWDRVERERLADQVKKQAEVRAEEDRQAKLQREANDEAERLSARARAGAARAADAGRLWVQSATVGGSGLRPAGAAAVASCPAAGEAAVLSADVLGQVEQRLRDLAEYADRASVAGSACERDYDAVTTPE